MHIPRLILVDGSGYIFRAFHGLPPLTRRDGTPVGAVYGFTTMLLKLRETYKNDHLVVIFDAGRVSFRSEMYPEYKMNRNETPEDLIPQFPLVREATRALAIPAIEQENYEADDLIASYAEAAHAQGREVIIISSDKDLMQLVIDGSVTMLDPMKQRKIGEAEVFEKFGVHPSKVVEVQALIGDAVDNVPGVPGIGPKTAAELIGQYGDLETLLANTANIKQPKRRESLELHADAARLSRRLVELKRDMPLPVALADLTTPPLDMSALMAFVEAQGFASLAKKVGGGQSSMASKGAVIPAAAGAPGSRPTHSDPDAPAAAGMTAARLATSYHTITTEAALADLIARAVAIGRVAVDTETTSLHAVDAELVGISLSVVAGEGYYIPLGHRSASGAAQTNLFGEEVAGDQSPIASKVVIPAAAGASGSECVGQDPGVAAQTGMTNPLLATPSQLPLARVLALLAPLFTHPGVLKIGHNIKYDLVVLAKYGVTIAPVADTMLMSYVLGGGAHTHGLDFLADKHFGHHMTTFSEILQYKASANGARFTSPLRGEVDAQHRVGVEMHAPHHTPTPALPPQGGGSRPAARKRRSDMATSFAEVAIDAATHYAAEDADFTLRLYEKLSSQLIADHAVTVYETIERPLIPVIARMEEAGIAIDSTALVGLSSQFAQKLAVLEGEIHTLAGMEFAVGSPKQLGEVLYDTLQLGGGKKSAKSGAYTTDAATLELLAEEGHAIASKVLEWRQYAKLKSTYTDALPRATSPRDGRVHTSFSMATTTTGRLSSSDPNLQNIPIRTEEGKRIRTAFVAPVGFKLLSADYSQIELRLLAHMADIPVLKEAFRVGCDIHAVTASQMFGVPVEQVDSELRRRAKSINFGIIYGISAHGLSAQLGISRADAARYIEQYFAQYPGIRAYMDRTIAFARAHGYVETLYGRRVHVRDINAKNGALRQFSERAAINAPLQGTAADIIKRAMVAVETVVNRAGAVPSPRLLLQVHDELIIEAPTEQASTLAAEVKRAMENVANLSVPLTVEVGIGDNWGAAH